VDRFARRCIRFSKEIVESTDDMLGRLDWRDANGMREESSVRDWRDILLRSWEMDRIHDMKATSISENSGAFSWNVDSVDVEIEMIDDTVGEDLELDRSNN
jgi:hypothetical protein